MRRILFAVVLACMMMSVCAQRVTHPVKLRTTELGNQKLMYVDSVYVLVLKSRYKPISVVLGSKEKALQILRFLDTAEVHAGDIIELENEDGDVARFNSLKQYEFFSPGRQYTGQMGRRYIKGYIEAIENHH